MKILPIFLSLTPLIAGVALSRSILVENYSQSTRVKSEEVATKRTIQQDLKNILELQKQSLMKLLPAASDEELIYNDDGEIIGIKVPEPVLASTSSIFPPNLTNITTPIGKVIFNNPLTRVSPVLAVGSVTPTPRPVSLSQATVSEAPTVVESTITPTPTPTEASVTPIHVKTKPVQATPKKRSAIKTTTASQKVIAQGSVVAQTAKQPKSVESKKEERKEQKEERKEQREEKREERKEEKQDKQSLRSDDLKKEAKSKD